MAVAAFKLGRPARRRDDDRRGLLVQARDALANLIPLTNAPIDRSALRVRLGCDGRGGRVPIQHDIHRHSRAVLAVVLLKQRRVRAELPPRIISDSASRLRRGRPGWTGTATPLASAGQAGSAATDLFAAAVDLVLVDEDVARPRLLVPHAHPDWHSTTTVASICEGMSDSELLTVSEIAALRGMNPSSVRLWVQQGLLPATKMGRNWVVRREDLEGLLAARPDIGHPYSDTRAPEPPPKSTDARAPAFDIAGAINDLGNSR